MSRLVPASLLVLLASPAWAERPAGTIIESAVTVDLTEAGFDQFVPVVQDYIPSSYQMPVVVQETTFPSFQADDCGGFFDVCYEYSVTNLDAAFQLVNPSIQPASGAIDFSSTLNVTVNSELNPMELYVRGEALEIDLSQDCDLWMDSIDVPISGSILVDYNPFSRAVSVDILPVQYDVSALNSDSVHIDDCAIDTINSITSAVGLDLVQLAIDQMLPMVEDQIDTIVDDLNDSLAPQIQTAVDAATVDMDIDVLGVPISVVVEPQDVEVTSDGLRILLQGAIDAPPDTCVARYGLEGSLETPSDPDPMGVAPAGIPSPHVAVQADDDLVNQALFAVWNGGLLCYTLDSETEGLPIGIDTDLLALLAPGVFDDLFPDSAPLVLQTSPSQPPVATLDGPNDIDVHLEGMGLDFYAEVDGRLTRLMQVDLTADAGANIGFEPTNGMLDVAFDFDTSAIQANVAFNELRPDANTQIASSLLGIVDSLAGPQLASLLAPQVFPIPAFEGYGLTSANIAPASGAPDRLGVYGNVGSVGYTGGCEGGGCDGAGAGCGDAGCDSTGAPGRVAIFAVPLLLAGLRRRRD